MTPTSDQPPTFDISRPSPARMYDFFLGGKDNFEVDRKAGKTVNDALGDVMTHDIVWENRRFLQRAVRFMAESGIDQFVDLGTGLPTQGNVHEIAQRANPGARVVYVDYDPIVLAHGRALLADNDTTTVITADMRDPDAVLSHPEMVSFIDFSRPVAVLSVAVLHFIPDSDDPSGIVRRFRGAMAPGSYLALSHLTTSGPPAEEVDQVVEVYKNATSPIVFRSREVIETFFAETELVDPGLVRPWQWQPDGTESPQTDWLCAAVGQIPAR
ncbi:MAG: SAM-dependent methyltransferase [Actinoallomurus sp.]